MSDGEAEAKQEARELVGRVTSAGHLQAAVVVEGQRRVWSSRRQSGEASGGSFWVRTAAVTRSKACGMRGYRDGVLR
jgi:hypothetical protein